MSIQMNGTSPNTKSADVGKHRKLKALLRLAVSAALVLIIYSAVDFSVLLATLSSISLWSALGFIALYTLGQVLSAVKWRVLIREIGLVRSYPDVLRAYFLGMFVNAFGLGTVGGDVARSLALKPPGGLRAASLATVVADRLHGLAVLAAIGALAILYETPEVLGSLGAIAAAGVALLIACAWLIGPRLLTRIFPESHRFGAAARRVALAFPRRKAPVLAVTGLSLVVHCIQITMHILLAAELGAPLSVAYLFATVPLVNIASSLPLSINGLGIREAMYIFLFVPAGATDETAVAFGAVWILSVTAVSALGGLIAATVATDDALPAGKTLGSAVELQERQRSAAG